MFSYRIAITVHLIAVVLWFGHMFFWSLISGIALKRVHPAETADTLRRLSLTRRGLGWPSLAILIPTGYVLLGHRGIGWEQLASGLAFTQPGGWVLATKLGLVTWMIFYQAVFGHRAAPRAIYVNVAAALTILGLSILLSRPVLLFS
jgi:uncharacterized membrane protein